MTRALETGVRRGIENATYRALENEGEAPAFPLIEPFTYADGALETVSGGLWANHGPDVLPVVSGAIAPAPTPGFWSVVRHTTAIGTDQYAKMVVDISGAATGSFGVWLRHRDTGAFGVSFVLQPNREGRIYLCPTDGEYSFGPRVFGLPITGLHTIELRAYGTTVTAFYDGMPIATTTYPVDPLGVYAGIYGEHYNGPDGSGDNWEAGPQTVPSPLPLALTQGAFGGGAYAGGSAPPRSLDLPDWPVTKDELLVVGLGGCSSNQVHGNPYWLLTGGGLTWNRRCEARRPTGEYLSTAAIFTAVATSTTTITDMLAATSTNGLEVLYSYAKASGFNASSPVGATVAVADDTLDGQKDITLSALPDPTSIIYAVAFENSSSAFGKDITPGTSQGWVERFDNSPNMSGTDNWGRWQGQSKANPTSTNVRWDDVKADSADSYHFAGCAIEIKAAP